MAHCFLGIRIGVWLVLAVLTILTALVWFDVLTFEPEHPEMLPATSDVRQGADVVPA